MTESRSQDPNPKRKPVNSDQQQTQTPLSLDYACIAMYMFMSVVVMSDTISLVTSHLSCSHRHSQTGPPKLMPLAEPRQGAPSSTVENSLSIIGLRICTMEVRVGGSLKF